MYTIHRQPDSDKLLISRDHDPANTIQLDNLAELVALRLRLTEYLDTLQADPDLYVFRKDTAKLLAILERWKDELKAQLAPTQPELFGEEPKEAQRLE